MLVIRREQIQAFEGPLLDLFIDQLIPYVRDSWAQRASEYADEEALRGFVSKCIRRSRALGFRDSVHLRKLFQWECEFGPGFAEKPEWEWLNQILTSGLDHASRIHRIENRLQKLGERDEN
jgi:hypothetical protein